MKKTRYGPGGIIKKATRKGRSSYFRASNGVYRVGESNPYGPAGFLIQCLAISEPPLASQGSSSITSVRVSLSILT